MAKPHHLLRSLMVICVLRRCGSQSESNELQRRKVPSLEVMNDVILLVGILREMIENNNALQFGIKYALDLDSEYLTEDEIPSQIRHPNFYSMMTQLGEIHSHRTAFYRDALLEMTNRESRNGSAPAKFASYVDHALLKKTVSKFFGHFINLSEVLEPYFNEKNAEDFGFNGWLGFLDLFQEFGKLKGIMEDMDSDLDDFLSVFKFRAQNVINE